MTSFNLLVMGDQNFSSEELSEICEDAFVNIKEACMRLQERTRCSNKVVIDMLNNLVEYYKSQGDPNLE